MAAAYHSISVEDDHDAGHPHHHHVVAHNCPSKHTKNHWGIAYYLAFFAVLLLAMIATGRGWIHNQYHPNHHHLDSRQDNDNLGGGATTSEDASSSSLSSFEPISTNNKNGHHLPALPTGVNLASWFSLEDWFFVGTYGAVEVATPDTAKAAACLPPLHVDISTGPRWNSETDLLAGLVEHYRTTTITTSGAAGDADARNAITEEVGPWGRAIRTIHAFRTSFYDIDVELRNMKDLGIQYVRVPLSWCWTDDDPSSIVIKNETYGAPKDSAIYMSDTEVQEKFTCQDPFYEDVYWPAIPRNYIIQFLRACGKYGIGATLDLHTYPGGTSIGTFSGVWPRYSRFWTHGDVPATENYYGNSKKENNKDIGRSLLKDFIGWVESLAEEDPLAFKGIRSISPMNEPAHLAGLYNGKHPVKTDRETFLPPLSKDVANTYLLELNAGLDSHPELTKVPDGHHLRVFLWLRDAIDTFRNSKLPSLGKELHVNVHESLFAPDVLPVETPDNAPSMQVFGAWWRASTTPKERTTWAVLDIHHYHAWGMECSGSIDGFPTSRYACSDEATKAKVLSKCATWPSYYRSALEGECGAGLRLASAEFSAATHHSVRHACNDVSTLTTMLESQVLSAKAADVELFWWSYKMPYGGAFRNAWSLKHLLYLMGVSDKPDEEIFHCGDHIPPPGEPSDSSI